MCSLEEAWNSEEFSKLENEDCDPNYFCLPDNYFDNPQGLETPKHDLNNVVEEENISNYNFNDDLLETNSIQQKNQSVEYPSTITTEENDTRQEEEPFMNTYKESFESNTNNQELKTLLMSISDRIDNIEKNMNKNNNSNNNIHDVILFIIIGVFILFALDSIFKIGKMTI
jgi:hypothetical protein